MHALWSRTDRSTSRFEHFFELGLLVRSTCDLNAYGESKNSDTRSDFARCAGFVETASACRSFACAR